VSINVEILVFREHTVEEMYAATAWEAW